MGIKVKRKKDWLYVVLAALVFAASSAPARSFSDGDVPVPYKERNITEESPTTPIDENRSDADETEYMCKSAGLGQMIAADGTCFYDGVGSANGGKGTYLYFVDDQLYAVIDGEYWEVYE